MGASPVSEIFQRQVFQRLADVVLKLPKVYIEDILTTHKHTFEDHIIYIDHILKRLKDTGLQINLNKSAICQTELDYFGFWVITKGYKLLVSRIQGIM